MPAITFGKFNMGLDTRKNASVSDANRLLILKNAYINAGLSITKRPGRENFSSLGDLCRGLFYFRGYLRTFSHTQSARDNLPECDIPIICHVIKNVFEPDSPLKHIHQVLMFGGKLYVVAEYQNGDVLHHYISSKNTVENKTNIQFAKPAAAVVKPVDAFDMEEPQKPLRVAHMPKPYTGMSFIEKYEWAFRRYNHEYLRDKHRDDGGA